MAKFPEHLTKKRNRTVNDLRAGERAQVALCMILADDDGNAFVFNSAQLAPPQDTALECGDIWLDESGKYHVDLRNTQMIWETRDLDFYKKKGGVKPIETIAWSPRTA